MCRITFIVSCPFIVAAIAPTRNGSQQWSPLALYMPNVAVHLMDNTRVCIRWSPQAYKSDVVGREEGPNPYYPL